MSLVPTYVRAVDGLFYKDPVLTGPEWFICFDDDDPAELVVTGTDREEVVRTAKEVLESLGCFKFLGDGRKCGSRHHYNTKTYRPAFAWWLELIAPIPVPAGKTGRATTKCPCVVYDPVAT